MEDTQTDSGPNDPQPENNQEDDILDTVFYDQHVSLGAKMVPFAGYMMPVQYPMGVLKEHLHTREKVGLFDVSHMGQLYLAPNDGVYTTLAKVMEKLVPARLQDLEEGQQIYTQILDEDGGIIDDVMLARLTGNMQAILYLVANAANKYKVLVHLKRYLEEDEQAQLTIREQGLLALQGPKAEDILATFNPEVKDMAFMTHRAMKLAGPFEAPVSVYVSRSGYTGEDGFEITIRPKYATVFFDALLDFEEVEPIGLGARDSLRLEAGLCLHGHDIDTSRSPVEAGLLWSISKDRRGKDAGYFGAGRVATDIESKASQRLVCILPEGRAPAREGTEVQDMDGNRIGEVTSGGFGPTVDGPIAMGYVDRPFVKPGTKVQLLVRGKARPAKIVKRPFVPHNYYRG